MKFIDIYIYVVLFIKLLFFISTLLIIILENLKKKDEKHNNDIKYNTHIKDAEYIKDRLEFIFIFLMALLLIIIFNPLINESIMINRHTKLLLFIYGIIILINAEWHEFMDNSYIYKKFNKS
jgi:NADH:ubiquinone oxidoreductase subunit 3 (subunit A)